MSLANPSPEPMTDIGRLLADKDSQAHRERLNRTLEDELRRVRAKMAAGLAQQDYVHAGKRVVALTNAQIVLKSLHIYLDKPR
jgi:hypothetical protein